MFNYNIVTKPSFYFDLNIVNKIFLLVSKNIDITQSGVLNIVFVNDEEMKNLNRDYRKIDKVTDVLSFHYFDDFSSCKSNETVGEIILCESKIISQGEKFGLGSEKEFYKLIIHSILHILGFDHENDEDYEEMNKYEKLIWEEVGL